MTNWGQSCEHPRHSGQSEGSQTRGLLRENLISLADGLAAGTVTLVDEVKKAKGRGRHGRPNLPLQPTGAAVDVSDRG